MRTVYLYFLSKTAQIICFILSVVSIYGKKSLSVPVLLASIYLDIALPSKRYAAINSVLHLALLLQSIALFVAFTLSPTEGIVAQSTFNNGNLQLMSTTKPVTRVTSLSLRYHVEAPSPDFLQHRNGHVVNNQVFLSRPVAVKRDIAELRSATEFKHPTSFVSTNSYAHMDAVTKASLTRAFRTVENLPPAVEFPELKLRSSEEVRSRLSTIFKELPRSTFLPNHRNPCWLPTESDLTCLPYVYVLGQPRCGLADLLERLQRHPDVVPPDTKNVRWLQQPHLPEPSWKNNSKLQAGKSLGPESSIFEFAASFEALTNMLRQRSTQAITFDSGPHTFWWPLQQEDGSVDPEDIPTPQILREMQPTARFIITLSDPVRRLYSDYYSLNDDNTIASAQQPSTAEPKSAQQLHTRVQMQIYLFQECVSNATRDLVLREHVDASHQEFISGLWFRASQICAHDRRTFGKAGWGRMSVGLYALYLEKWIEHFPIEQFLVLRLEDYNSDPRSYMRRIYKFLGLREPTSQEWKLILDARRFSYNSAQGDLMLPETEKMLTTFYQKYNDVLSYLLNDSNFTWLDPVATLLRNNISNYSGQQSFSYCGPECRRIRRHQQLKQDHSFRMGMKETFVEWPRSNFSVEGLPEGPSDKMETFLSDHINLRMPPRTVDRAGRVLSYAVFALDIPAIKYLLLDVGVPATTNCREDSDRPPFVTLSLLGVLIDGHPKSKVFSLLKGLPSWIDKHLQPALPLIAHSVHSKDIIDSLEVAIHNVSTWLIRAGSDVFARDSMGYNALEHASIGGMIGLTREILTIGNSGINSQSRADKRTALHYALAYGRVSIAKELVRHGADLTLADKWKVTGFDILANPGAVSAEDALQLFDVKQRPVRTIDRVIHPEQLPHVLNPTLSGGSTSAKDLRDYYRSWPGGTGGWGPERLKGYEDDMQCDVDQYWADEITSEKLFTEYIARNAPVLIRGLIHDWEVIKTYNVDNLLASHGAARVQVSDIPYSDKFGGEGSVDMYLRDYIKQVRQHRVLGGTHPWYVFKSHQVPNESNSTDSLVHPSICPVPPLIEEAMQMVDKSWAESIGMRVAGDGIFINAQWAVGGEGTGAPVHYHNTAWNALIYGAKKWVIYPPEHQIMSNRQILNYIETDMQDFASRPGGKGFSPKTCVQTAGDVMIIPESWGHGVLNIQESIAVATEMLHSHWRVFSGHGVLTILPNEDPNLMGRRQVHNRHQAPP